MPTSQHLLLQALFLALIGPCSWEFVSAASSATDVELKDYSGNVDELQKVQLLSMIANDLKQHTVLKKQKSALEDTVSEKNHYLEMISKAFGCPIDEVTCKIEDMKDRMEVLEQVLSAATGEVSKSHEIIQNFKEEIVEKEKNLEDLNKQLSYLQSKLQSEQIKQQNEKIDYFNIQSVLKQERLKVKRLEDELAFGIEMKDSYRKSIAALEQEKKGLQSEVAKLQVALYEQRATGNAEGEAIGIPIDNVSDWFINKTESEFRQKEESFSRVITELSINNSELNLKIKELQDEVLKAQLKAKIEETTKTRLQQELSKETELREVYERDLREKQEEVDRLNFAMNGNSKKSFLYCKSMPSKI